MILINNKCFNYYYKTLMDNNINVAINICLFNITGADYDWDWKMLCMWLLYRSSSSSYWKWKLLLSLSFYTQSIEHLCGERKATGGFSVRISDT